MQRRPKAPSRAGGEALPDRRDSTAGFTEVIRALKGQSTVIDQVAILLKAYGRWPSYVFLMWEVTTRNPVVLAAAIIVLYRVLH